MHYIGSMVQTVSNRVVNKVMEATGKDQEELPILYECIDPEGLNAVIDRMSAGEVSFSYAGCAVTVKSDGSIRIDDQLAAGGTQKACLHGD